MREIKFRGKSILNGSWIYGFFAETYSIIGGGRYSQDLTPHIIMQGKTINQANPVILETVGQYTGLTDKNGKEIYEGDIVKLEDEIFTVVFDKGAFGLFKHGEKRGNLYHYYNFCDTAHNPYIPEIIGNIHDNPELLKQ
jgi:uncharacterized phage protein (TIGR01671 family)